MNEAKILLDVFTQLQCLKEAKPVTTQAALFAHILKVEGVIKGPKGPLPPKLPNYPFHSNVELYRKFGQLLSLPYRIEDKINNIPTFTEERKKAALKWLSPSLEILGSVHPGGQALALQQRIDALDKQTQFLTHLDSVNWTLTDHYEQGEIDLNEFILQIKDMLKEVESTWDEPLKSVILKHLNLVLNACACTDVLGYEPLREEIQSLFGLQVEVKNTSWKKFTKSAKRVYHSAMFLSACTVIAVNAPKLLESFKYPITERAAKMINTHKLDIKMIDAGANGIIDHKDVAKYRQNNSE